jgi:DUF4097 and DUF4098 domain-containing protein YvlB
LRATNVRWRILQFDTVSAETSEEQRSTVADPATLVVENSRGHVAVASSPGNEIVVTARKTAWGSSQSDAQATLTSLKVNVTQNADTVRVQVVEPPAMVVFGSSRSSTVDLTIAVPVTTAVTTRAGFGAVTLSGTTGNTNLQTNRGDVCMTDVSGHLKLYTDYGDITIERATASDVEAHAGRGTMSLTDVKADGAVTLGSDYGAIRFKDGRADSLTAITNWGEVALAGLTARGTLTARSDYGAVTVDQVQATSFDLYTGLGDIGVDGASGTLKAQTDAGSVDVKNGDKVNLDLRTNRGEIAFTGSLGDGPHTLQADSGNVRLRLSPNTALTFELQTDRGQIKSDFPVTVSGELSQTYWRGTINGGGALLTASTDNGDILLSILNP